MTSAEGLLYGYRLDGRGGGTVLTWKDIEDGLPGNGVEWIHLDRATGSAQSWLRDKSGLDDPIVDAMLADETRPRCTAFPDGLFVNLRGVNLSPDQDQEDMVSIRVWVEENRIISSRSRRLLTAQDIRDSLDAGRGPRNTGEFLVKLTAGLVERMGPVVADLDDRVDGLEDQVLSAESRELRPRLGTLRREAIALRRYIAPQRDALARLASEPVSWILAEHRALLREVDNRTTRYVEDLDAARERAAIIQDELAARLAEQSNRTMYLLSVIAGIFLPLGLLTGLLGINVGGMPGVESPIAFLLVCILLVVLGLVEVWLFCKFKWL